MTKNSQWWRLGLVAMSFAGWSSVAAQSIDGHRGLPDGPVITSANGSHETTLTATDAVALGTVIERALVRYFEEAGVHFTPSGRMGDLIAQEIAAVPGSVSGQAFHSASSHESLRGKQVSRGVFSDDVEFSLKETGSGPGDNVQLVFRTPEFDGETLGNAWSIVVSAEDSASPDDGKMFFSTPSFFDALQLFTDGSSILFEQRELTLRRLNSPPNLCTSLQEGSFYWDDQADSLCVCDGSSWAPIDSDNMGDCQ